jgi:hypothetical protein
MIQLIVFLPLLAAVPSPACPTRRSARASKLVTTGALFARLRAELADLPQPFWRAMQA